MKCGIKNEDIIDGEMRLTQDKAEVSIFKIQSRSVNF
jgi:hypothetical protein